MKFVYPQRLLGPRAFLTCVLAIELFIIMAIDMYLPALPSMQREFGVSEAYLNLTLFAFFAVGAIGVLLAGPLSDRIGRKPVLLVGCVLFILSSLGCAVSPTVEVLVMFRMIEALGYGVAITVETALIKDAFAGADLKNAMTYVQSFILIGPAAAPFIGTFILSHGDWRGIFIALSVLGVFALICTLLISETLPVQRRQSTGDDRAKRLSAVKVLKTLICNKGFASLVLILGIASVPYFAFLAVISYVLQNDFGVGYDIYNILYLLFCLVTIAAPYLYALASKRFHGSQILLVSIVLTGVSAVLLWFFGLASPFVFLLAFVPATLAEGVIRPLAYVVLLDQPNDRVGAASSFSHFSYNLFTAVATVLATLPWRNFIEGLAVITGISAIVMAVVFGLGLRGRHLDGGHYSHEKDSIQ